MTVPRKSLNTNPAGRTGKPIILPPSTFDDALRKILTAPPEPKPLPKKKKQTAKKR